MVAANKERVVGKFRVVKAMERQWKGNGRRLKRRERCLYLFVYDEM